MDDFIVTLINVVQTLGLGVAVVWLIYAGFGVVAARGDDTAIADARKRFIVAVLIMLALVGLKVAWGVIGGTYVALGFISTIFLIIFIMRVSK